MLIRNATVLSMDPEVGDLLRGDVMIQGELITAVGPDLEEAASGEVLDATGCLVVPGFVDTHRHMWEGALRGCAPRDTIETYFERVLPALARELDLRTAHHVRASILPSRLRDLGALVPGTTFVHGNGLDATELRIIADSGGSLSIAPVIELAMGLGQPMVTEAVAAPGLPVTLSVDVEVTGPTDMFSQMRGAYLAARSSSTGAGPTVRDVLGWATLSGAQALGLGGRTGSITPGKQADLLVLRADGVEVSPVIDPYRTVVLQMDRAHVDTVLVAGAVHRRGGRPTRNDTALVARAREVARRQASTGAGVLDPVLA